MNIYYFAVYIALYCRIFENGITFLVHSVFISKS